MFNGNIPTLDLHGETREIARILIEEFIRDSIKMGEEKVKIIHGIGTGVLKKEVQKVLKNNKNVEKSYIDFFNIGQTIVVLKKK